MSTKNRPTRKMEDFEFQSLLSEVKRALEATYNGRLHRAILYGSQARGDAHPGSDVDILVVLKGPIDQYRETRVLVDLELQIFDRHGVSVHLVPSSVERYADGSHPLIMAIAAEGVEL